MSCSPNDRHVSGITPRSFQILYLPWPAPGRTRGIGTDELPRPPGISPSEASYKSRERTSRRRRGSGPTMSRRRRKRSRRDSTRFGCGWADSAFLGQSRATATSHSWGGGDGWMSTSGVTVVAAQSGGPAGHSWRSAQGLRSCEPFVSSTPATSSDCGETIATLLCGLSRGCPAHTDTEGPLVWWRIFVSHHRG